MQIGQEVQRYELMPHLPDKIRQDGYDRNANANPKPADPQETPGGREEHRAGDAESEKAHRVARLHADAQNRANRRPPARISRLQQPDEKIGDGHAPKIVERNVLEHRALYKRNGRDSRSHGSQRLDMAVSAEFLRH